MSQPFLFCLPLFLYSCLSKKPRLSISDCDHREGLPAGLKLAGGQTAKSISAGSTKSVARYRQNRPL